MFLEMKDYMLANTSKTGQSINTTWRVHVSIQLISLLLYETHIHIIWWPGVDHRTMVDSLIMMHCILNHGFVASGSKKLN